MRMIKGFCLAFALVVASLIGLQIFINRTIDHTPVQVLRTFTEESKFKSAEVLKKSLSENTLVVMGSSELNSDSDKPSYPFSVFNTEDFNLLKVGQGGYQTLIHAGILGAIGPEMGYKKVLLILSPQWFVPKGIEAAAIPANLSISMVQTAIANENLSEGLKRDFIERLIQGSQGFEGYQRSLQDLSSFYLDDSNDPILAFSTGINTNMDSFRQRWKLAMKLFPLKLDAQYFPSEPVFQKEEWLQSAIGRAAESSTNNAFHIDDSYYLTNIQNQLDSLKNTGQDIDYSSSPEYEDLKLFLRMAKEQGIEVTLVSTPLHGQWADYTGFPLEKRQEYYAKIRAFAEAEDVRLADLSRHEYEPYFLKDIMHMGEVGWVYIDEVILNLRGN